MSILVKNKEEAALYLESDCCPVIKNVILPRKNKIFTLAFTSPVSA